MQPSPPTLPSQVEFSAAPQPEYAPLVIDWNPDRKRSNAEWRTLTVAEQGRVLKSIDASGYRLRIADHQLLIYHSLTKSGEMRSVLGHHTASETVIGKLDESGVVEPILLVE